jgi:hypothetical protein
MQKKKSDKAIGSVKLPLPWYWLLLGSVLLIVLIGLGIWQLAMPSTARAEAPEAPKILQNQAQMPFQILIPAYMPKGFDRVNVAVDISQAGPSGEPMVQLTYRGPNNSSIFVREWVPTNPDKEILAGSRPIDTQWGKGWLIKRPEQLYALWVDVGPLRVSTFSPNTDLISPEQVLQMAETLGPASQSQVFNFVVALPTVKESAPTPPFEVPINAQGVQEFTLVVTPGGYSPLRFLVKKDVPVRLTFKAIGEVGCGKELLLPVNPPDLTSIFLKSNTETKVFEWTPKTEGVFEFHCSHQMYRGLMYVKP